MDMDLINVQYDKRELNIMLSEDNQLIISYYDYLTEDFIINKKVMKNDI